MAANEIPTIPGDAIYTAKYCEENIYQIAASFLTDAFVNSNWQLFVTFISNYNKTVLLCQANASKSSNIQYPIIWDYHVILVLQSRNKLQEAWVYDFDTRLSKPCEFDRYFEATFVLPINEQNQYQSCFRVISAEDYISHFASDRSHMLDTSNPGGLSPVYLAEPPTYPCIRGKSSIIENNLFSCYVDMPRDVESLSNVTGGNNPYGVVLSAKDFYKLFHK